MPVFLPPPLHVTNSISPVQGLCVCVSGSEGPAATGVGDDGREHPVTIHTSMAALTCHYMFVVKHLVRYCNSSGGGGGSCGRAAVSEVLTLICWEASQRVGTGSGSMRLCFGWSGTGRELHILQRRNVTWAAVGKGNVGFSHAGLVFLNSSSAQPMLLPKF